MDAERFEDYQRLIGVDRREAARALDAFLASFASFEEKSRFVRGYLADPDRVPRIPHPLYASVVFPVLEAGFLAFDPWSLLWLERTAQDLYRHEALWARLGHVTDHQLAELRFRLRPDDADARASLLRHSLRWLRYSVHEWPAGVLHGTNGATLAEMDELDAALASARELDTTGDHAEELDDLGAKFGEYRVRLEGRGGRSR